MNMRNLAIWGLIAALIVGMVVVMQGNSAAQDGNKISYSEFLELSEAGAISTVTVKDNSATGETTDGRKFKTECRQGTGRQWRRCDL